MRIALFLLISSLSIAAEPNHIPKPFAYQASQAIFVQFETATYDITYDVPQKRAYATAKISFTTMDHGYPIFDSAAIPSSVKLDGQGTTQEEVTTPNHESKIRIVGTEITAGTHSLEISLPLTQLVEFSDTGVKSAFWMTDLTDRGYLERYLPSNYLFDQWQMTFNVHFIGAQINQTIYTNGTVTKKDASNYSIEFPHYFQASSVYFHTVPTGTVSEERFTFHSTSGKDIPGVLYIANNGTFKSSQLQSLVDQAVASLNHLEKDFVPFPHPSITIYVAGDGGMEYCGATMTADWAMNHELFHSYAARGIMPADGNAGWIDEALAVWWDTGAKSQDSLDGSSQMASHPLYTRTTDMDAYTFGADFMSYLNQKFSTQGGLPAFLVDYFGGQKEVNSHFFKTYTTSEFQNSLSAFYGVSESADFDRYVYGNSDKENVKSKMRAIHKKRVHHQYTLKELQRLL